MSDDLTLVRVADLTGLTATLQEIAGKLAQRPTLWMTAEQAAQYLGIDRTTLDRLKPPRVSLTERVHRYSQQALDEWMQKGGAQIQSTDREIGADEHPSASVSP